MTRRRFGSTIGVIVGFGVLASVLSVASQHAFAANSDGATIVLEGAAIAHGNLGLSGWAFAFDSFWSIDALGYALGVLVAGVRPELMHVVPASLAATVVLVGAYAAGIGRRKWAWVSAAGVVVILLGLPSHALAYFFLQGPWHVGTALYCLVAFCCLRSGTFGVRWAIAVTILAAGVIGDLQAFAFGVVPVLVVGLVSIARRRSLRAGLALVTAAPATLLLALGIRVVTTGTGTFRIVSGHRTASASVVSGSVGHALDWGAALLGLHAGPFAGAHLPVIVDVAHLGGSVVVLTAIAGGVVHLLATIVRPPPPEREATLRLENLLLIACFGDLVAYEVLTLSGNVLYARYLTAALIFAVVLGARYVGAAVDRIGRRLASRPVTDGSGRRVVWATATALGLGAVVAGYVSDLVIDAAQPPPVAPTADLVAFLASHNLDHGIAEYWAASILTVESRGTIRVRPVAATANGVIERDGHQTTTRWYDDKTFQYLIYERLPYGRITAVSAAKTYGPPARTYRIDRYTVMVWTHPIPISSNSVS